MKNLTLLLLALFFIPQHFTKSWRGNGYGHMNIYVESNLKPGDEVAVFCDTQCVGTNVVSEDQFTNIIASSTDGVDPGFVPGDSVRFRAFLQEHNLEFEVRDIQFYDNSPYWVIDGRFEQNGSMFVNLKVENVPTKLIEYKYPFYPNPVNNNIIHLPRSTLIELYNDAGRVVLSSDKTEVDISSLVPGVYVLKIDNKTYKLLKMK